MNITLSKRGDYGIRAAISLGKAYPESLKIREIVADVEIPANFASQILADLIRADLVESKAGKRGGYRLKRAPEEISVLEIIEASEGTLRSERCAMGNGPCRWESVCPLLETMIQATSALRSQFASTLLADLVRRDVAMAEGIYKVPESTHRRREAFEIDDWVYVEAPKDELSVRVSSTRGIINAARMALEQVEKKRVEIDPGGFSWRFDDLLIHRVERQNTQETGSELELKEKPMRDKIFMDFEIIIGPSQAHAVLAEFELEDIGKNRTRVNSHVKFRPAQATLYLTESELLMLAEMFSAKFLRLMVRS